MTFNGILKKTEENLSARGIEDTDAIVHMIRKSRTMLSELAEHGRSASIKWQTTADDAMTDAFLSEMAYITRHADKRRAGVSLSVKEHPQHCEIITMNSSHHTEGSNFGKRLNKTSQKFRMSMTE